ncbi:ABC-type transport system, involved in lipoprotein release, permease component [Daejeonella rubra]|uniref:ABC-type transport system, involved in lipoprotein release, permease component n=2 Tax=Daejeonella rubra TaxID=990371 RepID=A0A1G9S2U2_9SPHI|nr:ABC-type transport system, involved in lipoprotein release, permease component [Daejeonella rubra]
MAWRNIWRNKTRSIVIMLSIAIGLFSGIAILALYAGMMNSRVRTVIDVEVGHLQIHHPEFKKDYKPEYTIHDGLKMLKSLTSMPEVKLAVPRSIATGMLSTPGGSSGVQINGIIPAQEYLVSKLRDKIIAGNIFSPAKRNQIIIGKKLADKLKLNIGSKLVLTFTDSSDEIVSGAFRVSAIYQSNNAPLDEVNVYITMKEINSMLKIGDEFHEIVLILKQDDYMDTFQSRLSKRFINSKIETWREISPETNLLVKTTDQYSYIIMVIVMLALAFGIINTMLMAILERTKEIGMMLALGTNRIRIFFLVLLETFMLTFVGTPVGILSSWAIISYFNKKGLDLSGMGNEMMNSFGFDSMIYPEFPVDKILNVFLIVFLTALFSCLFPALKALSLQPVEALRR